MIRGWPEQTPHLVVAPLFRGAKSQMRAAFEKQVSPERIAQIPRSGIETPPAWASQVRPVLDQWWRKHGRPSHVIQYNVLDVVFSLFALHGVGYKGRVLAHVGTTLARCEQTLGVFNSKLHDDTVFIPVHGGVGRAVEQVLTPGPTRRLHAPVWNAVDLERFAGPFVDRAVTFGFAARMCVPEQKNWTLLIDAFRKLVAEIPGAKLLLAGDGPDQPRLRELAAGLPVEFVGNVDPDEMPGFYDRLDCFVMASHEYEGFANVLAEAIGSRCLMLGTDVPGVREPFSAGGGAEFCAADADHLASLMLGLHLSPATRARNRDMVATLRPRLSAEHMARAYYDAGLAEPAPS
jgi:glycosyltransferase involved in cell wall biosynthesis